MKVYCCSLSVINKQQPFFELVFFSDVRVLTFELYVYMLFTTSRIYWILINRVTKLYVNLNVGSICSIVFHSSFFLLYLNLIYYKKRFKCFTVGAIKF